jgi:Tfp pilus assembly protein PilV
MVVRVMDSDDIIVQLWHQNNYHWYLKNAIAVTAVAAATDAGISFDLDSCDPSSNRLTRSLAHLCCNSTCCCSSHFTNLAIISNAIAGGVRIRFDAENSMRLMIIAGAFVR